MSLSGNLFHYFVNYAVAFIAFGFIGRWYLWPTLKNQPQRVVLPPFLLYASLRLNGLMFLILGLFATQLQKAFANTFEIVGCAVRILTLAVLALSVLVSFVRAQDTPIADVAVGYGYIEVPQGFTFMMHGGNGAVAVNANNWLGFVSDFAKGGWDGICDIM